jgi:di- and tripeptidase/Cys-Gly metallodipeptidase DUG1
MFASTAQEHHRRCLHGCIQVCGPQRDLHSGNEGGVFNEPLSDLTKVLASLVDSHNNIMVPHFYEV